MTFGRLVWGGIATIGSSDVFWPRCTGAASMPVASDGWARPAPSGASVVSQCACWSSRHRGQWDIRRSKQQLRSSPALSILGGMLASTTIVKENAVRRRAPRC